MNTANRNKIFTAVLSAMTVTTGAEALAQGPVLEEVVVTATKREQGMQDVPIALAVMSGDKIDQAGLTELEDLAVYLPGIHIGESGGNNQIFIRGIGSGNNSGFEQSVGTFIDGVYFGRARNSRAAFLDIERVEVLKGPQSTLFGKNTVAGAINITTRSATDEFEAYVEGSYETEIEAYSVSGAVSGPITDTLRGRLVGKYYDSTGWMDNRSPGGVDGPQQESSTFRGVLEWDPTDRLAVSIKAEHGEFDVVGRNQKLTISTPTSTGLFQSGSDDPNFAGSLGFNTRKSTRSVSPSRSLVDENTSDILQATIDYNFDALTLRSITAWTEYDFENCNDVDYSSANFIDQCAAEDHQQFTQEFLLSSELGGVFDFMVGLYYQDADLGNSNNVGLYLSGIPEIEKTAYGIVGIPAGAPPGILDSQTWHTFEQNTETLSAFGQLTWNFTDRFRATAGARYSEDEKNAAATQYTSEAGGTEPSGLHTLVLGPAGFNFRVPYDYELDRKEDHVTGGVNLQYDIGDDIMVYGTVSNGYKAGGFDAANGLDISREFEDEKVLHYELGSKMELWDNRIRLNMAVFDTSFDDLQVSTFESSTFIVSNAGEASVQGFEADVLVALTDYITVNGALSLLDANYDKYEGAACTVDQQVSGECAANGGVQNLSGTPLQFAPDASGNIGIVYDAPISGSTDIVLSLDALYTDDILIAPDGDENIIQDSFWKVNARIAWQANDGSWMLALVGKNLTDETTFNWGNDASLSGTGFGFEHAYFHHIEKPRTYEFQVRYNF